MSQNVLLRSRTPEETHAIGQALGRALLRAGPAGAVIALEGPLGAGKTVLVQGLARGLGVSGYVRSPTFVLIHEYPGPVPLHHVDLYRLTAADLDGLGLEELLDGPGVTAIEWAERAEAALVSERAAPLPPEYLRVSLAFGEGDDDRLVSLEAQGDRYRRIAKDVAACVSSR